MKPEQQSATVQRPNLAVCKIHIKAIPGSTLISHRLDLKVVEDFTAREFGKTKKKELRDLDKEYESCFYYTDDKKYGYPTAAFFGAVMDTAVNLDIPKTQLRRGLRFLGDITLLKYKNINRRKDVVTNDGISKAPNIRHRPEFVDWSCELIIQYNKDIISIDNIVNLLNHAGFSSGIGDWRPSAPKAKCPGTHGMFEVTK